MKNKITIISTLLILLFSTMLFSSCSSLMAVTSATAELAGAVGLVDDYTANAISKSATSIGNAAEEITPEQEYFLGRAVAANIIGNYRVYNDRELQNYLNLICHSITVNSSKPDLFKGYFVQLLDSNELNAFATSGGHILVTKGLIKNSSSEDELAAVLAHEIAHIHLQHSIKSIKTSRYTQALMDSKDLAFIGASDDARALLDLTSDFSSMVEDVTMNMVNNGYSKTNEYDADNLALTILADSGYNPYALVDMLNMIDQKSNAKSGFGKTHPTAKSRIQKISTKLEKFENNGNVEERNQRFAERVNF